jgi:hypothetical protein
MTSAGLLRPPLVQIRSETKNTTQPEAGDSNIVFFCNMQLNMGRSGRK